MWLLNARTLKLELFESEAEVYGRYAILSHVWEKEGEVTFQDIQQGKGGHKAGFAKVVNACRRALEKDNLEHVWIDTCCIDKTSSAELSEAINSMYRWYFEAKVCYAYLADIPNVPLSDSRWFTRGWTLQELIAPGYVEFYNSEWEPIGSKISLLRELAEITRIDIEVLRDRSKRMSVSVAARMAWAANRETTRVEDRAYSLMGVFDVNMPMLYGEGSKAFSRLQEEIIRNSTDHSILAWTAWENSHCHLLFSPSPYGFRNAHTIMSWSYSGVDESFILSNKGLHITLPVLDTGQTNLFTAVLNCRYSADSKTQISLLLRKRPRIQVVPTREFTSTVCEFADYLKPDGTSTSLQNLDRKLLPSAKWVDLLVLREPSKVEDEAPGLIWTQKISINNKVPQLTLLSAWPKDKWSETDSSMTQIITGDFEHDRGYLVFSDRDNPKKKFLLAFGEEYTPSRAEPRLWLRKHTSLEEAERLKREESQRSASVEFKKGTTALVAEVEPRRLSDTGDLEWVITLRLELYSTRFRDLVQDRLRR